MAQMNFGVLFGLYAFVCSTNANATVQTCLAIYLLHADCIILSIILFLPFLLLIWFLLLCVIWETFVFTDLIILLQLAKKFHPDTNKDDADAEKKFQEVNRAYEVWGSCR